MSEEFKVEIVNPEKYFFSKEDVTEAIVPAFEGEMGILKDHIAIISFLKPGIIKIKFFFCSINNCLIAGSNKYATEEVLAANNNVKKTESRILFKYFFV